MFDWLFISGGLILGLAGMIWLMAIAYWDRGSKDDHERTAAPARAPRSFLP